MKSLPLFYVSDQAPQSLDPVGSLDLTHPLVPHRVPVDPHYQNTNIYKRLVFCVGTYVAKKMTSLFSYGTVD